MAVRASESWRDVRDRNDARCRRILETASPLVIYDLDWDAFGDHDIDADALRSLIYMRDVEGFTDRDLVGLTAHRTTLGDPLIRRFLGIWRAEEAGHAAAIDRYLRTYGISTGAAIPVRQ